MSFCAQDLSVLAYANGFTHWHYRTGDSLSHLLDDGAGANDNAYFAAAGDMLRPGDQITVNLIGSNRLDLACVVVAAIPHPRHPVVTLVAASHAPDTVFSLRHQDPPPAAAQA